MKQVNPAFIPRNHLVEAMIRAAVEDGDFAPFEALLAICTRPYDDQPGKDAYARPAQESERGTPYILRHLSCSGQTIPSTLTNFLPSALSSTRARTR